MSSCTCPCSTTRRRRPSAALVIATLALFMSMGGTSYAAIKAGSVGNKQLASNAVSATKIRAGAVTSTKIRKGSVTSSKLGRGSVSGSKIARNAVTSQSVLDGSLGSQDIARGSLGTDHLAPRSVNESRLTPDIADRLLRASTLVAPADTGSARGISTTTFTSVREFSASAAHAGTNLVQAQASLTADANLPSRAVVTCSIVRQRGQIVSTLASSPVSVEPGEQTVVPLVTLTSLDAGDVVRLQCTSSAWRVDVATSEATSALAAVRVGP